MKPHLFAQKIALAAFAREHVTPQQMDAIEEVYVAATAKLIVDVRRLRVDVRRLRVERDAALSEVARVKAEMERAATEDPPRVTPEEPTYEHSYPGIVNGEFIHTSDCPCGAWMGGSSSGAPEGIDPFGECPVAKEMASR